MNRINKEWIEEIKINPIFKDQKKTGKWIVRLFKQNSLVTLCAPPQWGKTGVSSYVSYNLVKESIDEEKVFFITGMSDKSWVSQTKSRVLSVWRKNVFHRNTLQQFSEKIFQLKDEDEYKNILIIIDECHLANMNEHILGETMTKLDLNDHQKLKEKNIKILQISATPSNSLIDANNLSFHACYSPDISDEYVSFKRMLSDERVFDKKNLEDKKESLEYLKEVTKDSEPMYHLIRSVSSGRNGFQKYKKIHFHLKRFCMKKKFTLLEMNMSKTLDEINDIYNSLSNIKPKEHTFILIKNMLGASKTLDDKYIGSIHESAPIQKDYSSEIQGLPGRLCGWTKKRGVDGVKIYCDKNIIEKYVELFESKFDYEKDNFKWKDNRLSILKSGKIRSKKSYLYRKETIESTSSENITSIEFNS